MRVIFDHQRFSVQKYGGVSRYYSELANHLSAEPDTDVEIFAPFHVNEYIRDSNLIRPFGARVGYFPGIGFPLRRLNSALSYLMLRRRMDVDIFHETYFSATDRRPGRSRTVLTVFDMIHELHPENFRNSDRTRVAKAAAVRRADHVVCISRNTQRDLIEITGVAEAKTSVVYLGCSPPSSHTRGVTTKGGRRFLLFVGERRGYKNFSRFLEAYASSTLLRESHFVVCFGGGELGDREKAYAQSLGLGSRDIIHSSGDDVVLGSLYRDASMLVYPSVYEGFGLPPLEAMAHGCPVACSATSSLPEVVGDAAELFDPLSISDIGCAIARISGSSAWAAELAGRGLDRAASFSWSSCASRTRDVYAQLLGTRR